MSWLVKVVSIWVLAFLASTQVVTGQSLVWERRYGIRSGSFDGIVRNSDSSFSVYGISFEPSHLIRLYDGSRYGLGPSIIQSRITKAGDTLWTKTLNESRPMVAAVPSGLNESFVLSRPAFPKDSIDITSFPYFVLNKTDTAGQVLATYRYKLNIRSQTANGMFQAANGDLVVYGYTSPGTLFGNTQCDWLLMRIAPDGRLKWWRIYNPLAGYACGCAATEDINGRITMVGTKDAQLATQVVDSNGVVVRPMKEIVVNTRNVAIIDTYVKTYLDGGLIISGNELSNPLVANLIRLDTAGNVIWKIREPVAVGKFYVSTDSTISLVWVDNQEARLRKYNPDGTIRNSVLIYQRPNSRSGIGFYDALFDSDGSATVVGAVSPGSGTSAYIARIANIGIPYDPVSVPGPVVHAGPLYGFPNPASREFTVTGLASGAPFQLYSISGQQHTVPTQRFDAQQVLDISALPSGLYFLKSGGRVLRFLRE